MTPPDYEAWWEEAARSALVWKRRCEDRDERIARLVRAVAALRTQRGPA